MSEVKLVVDDITRLAYLSLTKKKKIKVDHTKKKTVEVLVDYDKDGNVLGLEFFQTDIFKGYNK